MNLNATFIQVLLIGIPLFLHGQKPNQEIIFGNKKIYQNVRNWNYKKEKKLNLTTKIENYYDKINNLENLFILRPNSISQISGVKHLFSFCQIEKMSLNLPIKKKLNDFKNFQVYYSFKKNLLCSKCKYVSSKVGMIVFYSSSSKKAKILPIYYFSYPSSDAFSVHYLFPSVTSFKNIFLTQIEIGENEGLINFSHNYKLIMDEELKLIKK